MTVPEIHYPTNPSSPQGLGASTTPVPAATGDGDATVNSGSPAARHRVAKALLENAPTILQDSSSLAQVGVFLQNILDATKADLPASFVDEINALIGQFSATDSTDEGSLAQLQTAISTLSTHLAAIQFPTDTDLNEVFSEAISLLNKAAEGSPEIHTLMGQNQNIDLNKPYDGLEDVSNGKDPVAFMKFVLIASILMGQYESQNTTTMTSMSKAFVDFAKDTLDKVLKDMQAYTKAAEAEKNKSWLAKKFSYVVAGLLIAIGALSGQPELALSGLFMLTMKASGGQDKLDAALSKLPLIGRMAVEFVLAVAQAGAASLATAGLKSLTTFTAEEIAAGAARASVKVTGAKVVQQLASGQFYSDVVMSIMRLGDLLGLETSKAKEDEISGIAGAVLGMVLSFGAGFKDAAGGEAVYDLSKTLGEKAVSRLKILFKFFKGVSQVTAAGYNISASSIMFTEADIIKSRSNNEAALQLFNYVGDIVRSAIGTNQEGATAQAESDRDIAERMERIVNPWPV